MPAPRLQAVFPARHAQGNLPRMDRRRYGDRPAARQMRRFAAGLAPLLQSRAANLRRTPANRVTVPLARSYSSTSPSFRGAGRGAGWGAGAAGLRRIRISPFSSITGAS